MTELYRVDSAGWLQSALHCRSDNCNERPPGMPVDLLVIHNISLPPGEFGGSHVRDLFTNCLDCQAHPALQELTGLRVSAHVFIDRSGVVTQFVSFLQRAWHAGESVFAGRSNCNDFSIGIELEGTDTLPYTAAQYAALAAVATALMSVYPGIVPARIVGHSDIAPQRKTDPGPAFDWPRLLDSLAAQG